MHVASLTIRHVGHMLDSASSWHQGSDIDLDMTQRRGSSRMPLYLDTHDHIPGLTAEAVAAAHARDLEVQGKHGVDYRKYWFDETTGKVFCLVDAPSAEAAIETHREAHGLLADSLVEVREGA
jgi:hypothetical protein